LDSQFFDVADSDTATDMCDEYVNYEDIIQD